MAEVTADILALLKDALKETGVDLQESAKDVADYTAGRAQHLSTLVGQPGFELAVRAERDSVALFAGIKVSQQIDDTEARIVGLLQGILAFAAQVLAA